MLTVKIGNRILTQYFWIIAQQNMQNITSREKKNNANSKIKSKTRYDKTMNVKISDTKVGNKILIKQSYNLYIHLNHLQ